jgi:transcriptional regulator with XRE-family HTH domain
MRRVSAAMLGPQPPSPFGSLLQRYREQADFSRNALGRAIGCDPSYISRLERGDREPPRRDVVGCICKALDLPAADADRLHVAAGYAPAWLVELAGVARITPRTVAS